MKIDQLTQELTAKNALLERANQENASKKAEIAT